MRPRTFLLACCCCLACGCAVNPATGDRQLSLVSEEQEVQIGRQAAEQTRDSIGLVQDDALQAYLQEVGAKLAADSERPELPWSFQVVDDPTPNAFALPGGFIFVTRGMLNHMDSEAELAAVLGHEIAHVTARHSVQQMSRAQLAQLGLGLGMILFPEAQSFGNLLGSGLQLLFLKFGRDAEREADELGFGYALAENYDVREMDDVFATLGQISNEQSRSPLPAWASTHPDPGERIEATAKRVAALGQPIADARLGREAFLTRIDGLAWGENPRQGFFEGNRFLHPELAFQITFPEGWQTQNLPQVVAAGAPDRDAVIQMTLVPGTPEQAMQQFASQNGLRAGTPSRQQVNGLPANLLRFAAQTQQGALQGVAAFIPYRDRTYLIVGYAPTGRYAQRETALLRTIGSFAPVTDKRVLGVEAPQMDIVRIPRAMTLAEFAKAYPSAVDLKKLALLNQVEGPNAQLPAGRLVKRVVGEPLPSTKVSSAE